MRLDVRRLALAGLLLPLMAAATPPSAQEGEKLYRERCVGCHGSEVFTRKDRKMRSLAELRRQLDTCAAAAKTGWGEGEKERVLAYLNESFYRFPATPKEGG